jgi:hypothetical protein
MRFNIFAAIAIFCGLFLSACGGGKPEEQLVGKWKADVDAIAKTMMDDPRMAKMPEEAKKKAMEQGKKMLENMSMEFTKDGKMVMSLGKDMKEEGTYKVKAVNGKEVTIEGTMKGKTQTLKAMIDGGTLSMEVDGQKMVFKK